MTFAHGWGLALAALAAPVIAMYLYRLHRERRTVASALLLRVIRDEQPAARAARSKVRHRLSLALVLIALAFAILALVGPKASSSRASRVVIVIDRSASMGTRDGGGGRLARAAEAVSTVVDGASPGDEVALVAAGGEPGVIVPPTRSHVDIVAGAAAIAARGALGDNRDDAIAFRLADGFCRDADRTRIVVISDGAGLAIPPLRCPLETIAIGGPGENLGIAGLSMRSLDGLGAHDIHLTIASSSTRAQQVDVSLASGGEVLDVVRLDVPAGGDASRTLRMNLDSRAGDTLTATISGRDALALDDRAEIAFTDTGPVSVLLVTDRPKSLVGEALRLHPRVSLAVAPPSHLPTERQDLIVLETAAAVPLPPARHVVALGVGAGSDAPLTLGAATEKRTITRWDFDAPWFRFVDLRDVVVAKARTVAGGHAVVDSDSGAIVESAAWGDRELVVVGFALDETDLTLRAAFPNLVANLVDWAAAPGSRRPAQGVLSAAESHVTPKALPGTARGTASLRDGPWLAQFAVLLALALLLLEQAVYCLRRST